MGAVVPGPWRASRVETDVEVLTKQIEALERNLRRAIDIANEAVQDAQRCAEKAYQRGFREGFDRAFEAARPVYEAAPNAAPAATDEIYSDTAAVPGASADAEQPGVIRPKAGLLGWLRRKRIAETAF